MVWVVTADGFNDYFDVGSGVTASTNSYVEIKFRVETVSGTFYRLITDSLSSGTQNRVIVETNGDRVIVQSGGLTFATWSSVFGSAPIAGDVITIKVETTGGVAKRLYVNGVDKGTANTNATDLGRWRYFGGDSFNYSNISFFYIDFTDSATPANSSYWDATASSHAPGTPILSDTAGSRNATGTNMLTDGSVWTDLGGGSTTVTAQNSEQAQSSTNVTLVQYGNLTIQNSGQAQRSDNTTLSLNSTEITAANSIQLQASGNVDLLSQSFVIASVSEQAQISGNATLTAEGNITSQNSTQSQISENITLSIPGINISAASSNQSQASTNTTLLAKSFLSIDTTRQTQVSQSVNFGGVIYALDGQILLNVRASAKLSATATLSATILING